MSRTPRDSTYMRVVAGGDYDADWDEHYAPPPPPMTRTVNGTGHTGASEFCATSI